MIQCVCSKPGDLQVKRKFASPTIGLRFDGRTIVSPEIIKGVAVERAFHRSSMTSVHHARTRMHWSDSTLETPSSAVASCGTDMEYATPAARPSREALAGPSCSPVSEGGPTLSVLMIMRIRHCKCTRPEICDFLPPSTSKSARSRLALARLPWTSRTANDPIAEFRASTNALRRLGLQSARCEFRMSLELGRKGKTWCTIARYL